MSDLSAAEKQYKQAKKKLHQEEANFALDFSLEKSGIDEVGDYIWALGSESAMFSRAEAVVFRISKSFFGKKSYQFGLFPPGTDHQVFIATQRMVPVSSFRVGLEESKLFACPTEFANQVHDWIKAEKRKT